MDSTASDREGGRGTNDKSVDGQLPHPCTCCHSVDISRNRAQDEPKASRWVCQGATLYLEAQLWVIVASSSRTSASLKPNAARHEYMFRPVRHWFLLARLEIDRRRSVATLLTAEGVC